MKNIFLLLLFLICISLVSSTLERIERFAGKNATELKELYQKGEPYHQFLLDVISPNDLAVVTVDFLQSNLHYALESRTFVYCEYDDLIFRHFVLPYRVTQEPIETWRPLFFETLTPLVKNAKSIEEAAIIVNLWVTGQMTFKQTHGRDQTPLTTIKRGYGRCEESMIIYIAAARAVGIPARPASVPFWNFTDNNHAWVEIWTPQGWKYLGEAENALNRAWFSKTTERATLVTAHAIGNFYDANVIKQENNVTTISSIEFYNNSKLCEVLVLNEQNTPIAETNIFLYAVSYGGLFAMSKLQTDKLGKVQFPLGDGTVYVSAYQDGQFAAALLPIMETDKLTLQLSRIKVINENLIFLFPIPTEQTPGSHEKEILGDSFYLQRENAHLKRKERLFNQYYQQSYWHKMKAEIFDEQILFLTKCDELAGNSRLFLEVFQTLKESPMQRNILVDMILEWDIKELIEIPDKEALLAIIKIYSAGKIKNSKVVSDSLFRHHVIKRLWTSSIPPENGWQEEFYEKIKHLAANQLDKTVLNVVQWVDENVIIDSNFVFTYFSGSLNPLQMLNMKYIPDFYRTVLIKSALKQLGVPLQWKGRLEFFNGNEFVALSSSTINESKDEVLQKISLQLFVDNKQIKAEPFSNFLISNVQKNGEISYIFFEGENDSLVYNASFRRSATDVIFAQAAIRNANGDANVLIRTIQPDDVVLNLKLYTPVEYVDVSSKWHQNTLRNIKHAAQKKKAKFSILFILGEEKNEPEERMFLQLLEKKEQFVEKQVQFQIISKRSSQFDYITEKVTIDKKIISESIPSLQYPLLFLLNDKNELLFSSRGYTMGIAELLLRKME
jgi:transglutaminase-like putative cysteine protease